ncbi:ATP-binding protein [Ideonella livida]|uniref:histidine kinase n=1 Tax=Ideonella livida TaxID=2707176 RepID=A0A7C9TIE4_9BURK|nr:ATP-binding protein [Ideonella livida]NDY90203.1 response regulator [Ideonella livida]
MAATAPQPPTVVPSVVPAAQAQPPAATAPGPSAEARERAALDQVTALYRQSVYRWLGGAGFAGLLAWSLAMIDARSAWLWLAIKATVLAGELANAWAWHRGAATRLAPAVWRRRHGLGSTLDGLGWGLVALWFLPSVDGWRDGLLVAGLLGIASLGMFSLSAVSAHAVRFMAGALGPLVLTQVPRWPEPDALVMGVGILIYMAVVALQGRRTEARQVELLRLRFDNARMLAQLEQALAAARESDATKTRFLATVSHELRTPLNGVTGLTQLLQLEPHLPGQVPRLTALRQSADHLHLLINDVLDLARSEFGRLALAPVPTALAPLVQGIAALLHGVAHDKGLTLQLRLQPGLPDCVAVDPARLRQILLNLLGNALKFTPQGEVSLTVAREGDWLQFVVQDGGPGVPPAERERIFEAFAQGQAAHHSAQPGSGLGLTIARELAHAMGGGLACVDSPAPGARFELRLPCRPAPTPCAPPAEPPAEPHAEPPAQAHAPLTQAPTARAGADILVAEDNAVNAEITLALLDHLGHRGQWVPDGYHALQALRERAQQGQRMYDLVLMDGQMPLLDGWQATRQWRAQEAAAPDGRPRLPIVALTASALPGDRELALLAGMDDLLAKPFTREALAQLLDHWLPAAHG